MDWFVKIMDTVRVEAVVETIREFEKAVVAVKSASGRVKAACQGYQRPKHTAGGDWGVVKTLQRINPNLKKAKTLEDFQTQIVDTVELVEGQRATLRDQAEFLEGIDLTNSVHDVRIVIKQAINAVQGLLGKLIREECRLQESVQKVALVPPPKNKCMINTLPDELIAMILKMVKLDARRKSVDDAEHRRVCRRWHDIVKNHLRNTYADFRWQCRDVTTGLQQPLQRMPRGIHLGNQYTDMEGRRFTNVLCTNPNGDYVYTKKRLPFFRGHQLPIENPTMARMTNHWLVTLVPQAQCDTIKLWRLPDNRGKPELTSTLSIETGVAAVDVFDDGSIVVGTPLEIVLYKNDVVVWRSSPIMRMVNNNLFIALDHKRGRIMAVNDLAYWRIYNKSTGDVFLAGGRKSTGRSNNCLAVAINSRAGVAFWLAENTITWRSIAGKKGKSGLAHTGYGVSTMCVAHNDYVYLGDGVKRFWVF